MSNQKFVYVTYIASTPQKVWKALLDGEFARQYWRHELVSDSEFRQGSEYQLVAADGKTTVKMVGEVLENKPGKRLVLSWAEPSDADDKTKHTRAAIDIETVGDMVRVTVTHDQLFAEMERKISKGWPLMLSSMKSFLEIGRPLNW